MRSKSNGFSLLEVLIAGLILFSTIATTTLVYSNSILSTKKASDSIPIDMLQEHIVKHVQTKLRTFETAERTGEGYLAGIVFQWNTEISERMSAYGRYNTENMALEASTREVVLWNVTLQMQYKEKTKSINFAVVGWLE